MKVLALASAVFAMDFCTGRLVGTLQPQGWWEKANHDIGKLIRKEPSQQFYFNFVIPLQQITDTGPYILTIDQLHYSAVPACGTQCTFRAFGIRIDFKPDGQTRTYNIGKRIEAHGKVVFTCKKR